jgi:hypothetical protein
MSVSLQTDYKFINDMVNSTQFRVTGHSFVKENYGKNNIRLLTEEKRKEWNCLVVSFYGLHPDWSVRMCLETHDFLFRSRGFLDHSNQ